MELIEYLRDNKDLYRLAGIDDRLGLGKDCLKNVISGRCLLSEGDGGRVISLLSLKGLSHTSHRKRSVKVNWVLAIDYPTSSASVKYRVVGGKLQIPVLRSGKLMVRV